MATRILVVDDEPAVTDLLAYNLRAAHFEVLVAADGREAIRRCCGGAAEDAAAVAAALAEALRGAGADRLIIRPASPDERGADDA
jgi:DNA-binding NtrC family response regulator